MIPPSLTGEKTPTSVEQKQDVSGSDDRLTPLGPNMTDAVWSSVNVLDDQSASQALDRRIILAQSSGEAAAADAGPPPSGDDELAALAQKTNNPVSDAWLLITQNDTTIIDGDLLDQKEVLNTLKFQPVLSVPIWDDAWNLVFRPVFQLVSSPLDDDAGALLGVSPNEVAASGELSAIAADPFGRTNGLGDTVLFALLSPNTTDGWIYAAGATSIFPTAQQDILGQEKWQAGPAGLLVRLGNDYGGFGIEHFNIGALVQQWWSYAGDSNRDSTNQMDIQYFLNWKSTPTQLIGMTPNISINWDADGGFDDKVALPIGMGTIGLTRIGGMPIRWGLEAQYYVSGGDDIAREANFRFFIAPVVANPFK